MSGTRTPARVSVVLPVRNEAQWIRRALRSLQRQTLTDFDVVVVDDHSTDTTASIVAAMARRDGRIRVVPNQGSGFTSALNTGLAVTSAPLVARLDADDAAMPRRLERQVHELARNPRALVLGTYGLRVNEWGVPVGWLSTGPRGRAGFHAAMAAGEPIRLTHSSTMYRRRDVLAAGGYDADYYPADDYDLWNRLAQEGEVYALPRPLTLYTLRRGCITVNDAVLMAMRAARVEHDVLGRAVPPWEQVVERATLLQHRRRVLRALLHADVRGATALLRASEQYSGSLVHTARVMLRRR